MGGGCSRPMTISQIYKPPIDTKNNTIGIDSSNHKTEDNISIKIEGSDSIEKKNSHIDRKVKENYIICKFAIPKKELEEEIRIINGVREKDNIKNYCKLFVNNKEIEFNYKYKFNKNENQLKIVCNDDFENAKNLFANCIHIKEFDFSNFNSSKIINLEGCFFQCISLHKLDLSNFNCNNLTNMCGMFGNCNNLKEIILPKNTENVTNMSFLFINCSSLEKIDFSNFNTNNVIYMNEMFSSCSKMKELDLSNFNTEKVQNMSKMFYKCVNLSEIKLSSFKTNNVQNMSGMFSNCINLENLDLSTFNTNNVIDMSEMFSECLLKEINLYELKTPKVKKMNLMFNKCEFLTQLDISNFTTNNDTDVTDMFKGINKNCILTTYNNKIKNSFTESIN